MKRPGRGGRRGKAKQRQGDRPPRGKKKTKFGKSSDAHSGKRTFSECCATVEDAPSSSTGKCKETMVAPPETKKVSAKEDGTGGTFTISATLDPK